MITAAFTFGKEVYHSETSTIEVDGFEVIATIYQDDTGDDPWDREEGHGPVSKWTTRDKAPGERVLCQDRSSKIYYDFAEAVKIARKDGWGSDGDEGLTPGAKAARAVEADFERLRAFCAGGWGYIGVAITVSRKGVRLTEEYAHALWGIESDCGLYCNDVAKDLTEEAIEDANNILADLLR